MELLLSICIGIGLSAACGYRVFVPLLGISLAATSGHITLPSDFEWIGSNPALAAFAIATILEVGGYYIPLVDNFLDAIAGPAAVIAGTIVMASVITGISPFLKWSLAIIAGGGTASIFQGSTTLIRSTSTATTAGMGNFAVTTIETGVAAFITLLALFSPVISGILVLMLLFFVLKKVFKRHLQRNPD
jgi:hypothetical protein